MEHTKKRKIVHPWVFRGAASVHNVTAQCIRAQGNSLTPHGRLQTSVNGGPARTTGKLPKQHAWAIIVKSRDVWHANWGFYHYLVGASDCLRGGVLAALDISLSGKKKKRRQEQGVHPKIPIIPTNLCELIPTPATFKGQRNLWPIWPQVKWAL